MQTNPAVEQNKNIKINSPRVRGISPVGKEKVYGGNDLPNSQVLSSEWKTERVREDASGDREDGEDDDELPCVVGESEGDCAWRGSRRSVGSSFHRQGAAYWKERLVIFKEDRVGVRAMLMMKQTKRGGQQHRNADSEEDVKRTALRTGSFIIARQSAAGLDWPTAVHRTLAHAVSHIR